MIVPRSYHCAPSPPKDILDEKRRFRPARNTMATKRERRADMRPSPPTRTTTEHVLRATGPSIPVRAPARTHSPALATTATLRESAKATRPARSPAHDPKALPPAVAALLAVTQTSRPKSGSRQQRSDRSRRISVDELVKDWENEASVSTSYGSSPSLSILLEDTPDGEQRCMFEPDSIAEESLLSERSLSNESVPSLDPDGQSLLSNGSPSTPESVRSRRSISNLKKETPRSVPTREECAFNHPLIPLPAQEEEPEEVFVLSPPRPKKASTPKAKPRLTSNLTTSLQALKSAAISSLSSFSGNGSTSTPSSPSSPSSPLPDDVLWSHPFLFPHFSPEIRPAIEGTPTEAQRRYLNPIPLTFEEQEAPYQLALHAPYLAQAIEGAPAIQMQTYNRGKRKSGHKRGGLDPASEAGRALLGAAGVRHREVRENSDFLRVVVMEMNMKRSGKLAYGKARIWLPPRKPSASPERTGKVPRRWVGESAY